MTPVGILVENRGVHAGRARLRVLADVGTKELVGFVRGSIDKDRTTVWTDGFQSYLRLHGVGIRHRRRIQKTPRDSIKHLPWVHAMASNLKTWLRGTFHGVSAKHLPRYLDEFNYRFDRHWREQDLFGFVAQRVARGAPLPYAQIVAERRG